MSSASGGITAEEELSEQGLKIKGIWNYVKNLDAKQRNNRMIYGFVGKRGKSMIKFFQSRWFFLMSSRPLKKFDYLEDDAILKESILPSLLEFDVLYYYSLENEQDDSAPKGSIRLVDVVKIDTKDMRNTKLESGHSFYLDCGKR